MIIEKARERPTLLLREAALSLTEGELVKAAAQRACEGGVCLSWYLAKPSDPACHHSQPEYLFTQHKRAGHMLYWGGKTSWQPKAAVSR